MKFKLFKRKIIDMEVTSNPDVLFNLKIVTSEILVHGLKLGSNANLIPLNNVSTTTFEKNPDGITQFIYKDNKVFYKIEEMTIEYPLNERIGSVLKYGGILHMKTGAKYVIKDNSIVGIGIHDDLLLPYKNIKKKSIEKRFGRADKLNETFEEVDGTLFYTEYSIIKRQMFIHFDDWKKMITIINLGQFYNK